MRSIKASDIEELLNSLSDKDKDGILKANNALEYEKKRFIKKVFGFDLIISDNIKMTKLHPSYKKMNKKQLLGHLERQMNDNVRIVGENVYLNKQVEQNAKDIQAMENALLYKERVIERYKELLTTAVEHLSV